MKDKTKINNIPDAVKLLDDATSGEITSNEYPENISILKACKSAGKFRSLVRLMF